MKKADRLARAKRATALLAELGGTTNEIEQALPDVPAVQKQRNKKRSAPDIGEGVGLPPVPGVVHRKKEVTGAQEPDSEVVGVEGGTYIKSVPERHWPKKHAHGALTRGDSVWYGGTRWWVEWAATHWSRGCYVRIVDKAVHPDAARPLPSDLEDPRILSFCVHADLLSLAPVRGGLYTSQPSLAGVARAERAKAGIKDVGDDVAILLRECKSIDQVYACAAKYCGVAEPELKEKYGHLNPGQQRMNCGNKMRAHWRRNNK